MSSLKTQPKLPLMSHATFFLNLGLLSITQLYGLPPKRLDWQVKDNLSPGLQTVGNCGCWLYSLGHSYGGPQSTEGYAIGVQEPLHFLFPLAFPEIPSQITLGRELPLIYTRSYCLSFLLADFCSADLPNPHCSRILYGWTTREGLHRLCALKFSWYFSSV